MPSDTIQCHDPYRRYPSETLKNAKPPVQARFFAQSWRASQEHAGRPDARRYPPLTMPCYSPMKAFRPLSSQDGGRLVFNPAKALNPTNPISLPCGQCVGCRIAASQEAATRCYHESQMHQENCFLTLTFSDDHLPENYSVTKRDVQLFVKRLRKYCGSKTIRYFANGEYGDKFDRPHYHLLIFNHDFNDKTHYSTCPHTHQKLYTSEELSKLWKYGHSTLGAVTYKSAAYVARYIMKKINGDRAVDHYMRQHPTNLTWNQVEPEFVLRSGNLGLTWFNKYKSDAFPSDFLVVDGRQTRVPRFYDTLLKQEEQPPSPDKKYFQQLDTPLHRIKQKRRSDSRRHAEDQTPARLRVREFVKTTQLNQLKRNLKDH